MATYFVRTLIFATFLVGLPTVYAVEAVSPERAAQLVAQGVAELIDVRERLEIDATGMATPAQWLAKSEVDSRSQHYQNFVDQLEQQTILIFYCRSGSRARVVANHFETLGFQTMNMGGFDDWVNAELPVSDVRQNFGHRKLINS